MKDSAKQFTMLSPCLSPGDMQMGFHWARSLEKEIGPEDLKSCQTGNYGVPLEGSLVYLTSLVDPSFYC